MAEGVELYQKAEKLRPTPLTERQRATRELYDRLASERDKWLARNRFFYDNDRRYMQFLVPSGQRVLELGCGEGQLLRSLQPSHGVGVDLSQEMINLARKHAPEFEFHIGNAEDPELLDSIVGPFDYIILSDMVGYLEDCGNTFETLQKLCTPKTRLVVAYYSHLWEPVVRLSERIGAKMPSMSQNWLSIDDTTNLLRLAGFEVVRQEWRQLMPKRLLGIGTVLNKVVAPLPGIRRFCLRNYVVARPVGLRETWTRQPSCSILIPCRNERGNIENAVKRLPQFAADLEILFVEGHSNDGTYEECLRVKDSYPDRKIRTFQQPGKGKGDAIRLGFAHAQGEVVMILDADLTVPPESVPKFYRVLVEGHGEFVNGTRLVYPMSDRAMRTLNAIANRAFAMIFSYLLNQRLTDTLCGTKALWRRDYERIAAARKMAGECRSKVHSSDRRRLRKLFRQYRQDVVKTDITAAPWLNLVADAETLPFKEAVFSNIVMFDVLHHIEFPRTESIGSFLDPGEQFLSYGGEVLDGFDVWIFKCNGFRRSKTRSLTHATFSSGIHANKP